MKTDALFTVSSFNIPIKSNKPFHLVFFGDVHRDSRNHALGAWKDFLAYAKKLKDAYFIGMGDYVDSASSSERDCLEGMGGRLHESTKDSLADLAGDKVRLIAGELSFMKGRLIGLVNGNHYFNFQDGTNTDMRLCGLLDCKYLGVSSFIRLSLDCFTRKTTLDVWVHHGAGGSRLPGGSINRVDQMREHAEADIYAMGHDHKRGVWPANPRLHLQNSSKNGLSVKSRQQWLIRSGSFLASYEDGKRNYNVDAGRGPCSLGHVELIINVSDNHRDPAEVSIRGLS